jgi:hypothetical protein
MIRGQAADRLGQAERKPGRWPAAAAHPWTREVAVLAAFLAAGIAATWPLASYLTGRLPVSRDVAIYVWDLWWVAHQIIHLHNPWFTTSLAAPAGLQLGYQTLIPLLGVVMTPVTLAFGPSASYNLLIIVLPGLACYAMYRAARLWLPTRAGAIAAGAFFGLSGMLAYQAWYHINIAYGAVFLPVTLEAAVRLRRDPSAGRGVILGVVLGASALVNQESAVMALIVAALALIPWLAASGAKATDLTRLRALVAAAVTGVIVASPQLVAMYQQARAGETVTSAASYGYTTWVANLPGLFAPSPRLVNYGLTAGLGHIYTSKTHLETLNTFGLVLSVLAVLGLIASWRRRSAWLLALLWLGGAALALGPVLYIGKHMYVPLAQTWDGLRVSLVMPYTWFLRAPGLSIFREADRFALLGLVGAALLAGAAVDWLASRLQSQLGSPGGAGGMGLSQGESGGMGPPARKSGGVWGGRPPERTLAVLLGVVAVLGALEAGWSGGPGGVASMPTTLTALDGPIAADHSGSIVVDVPFGLYNLPFYGQPPTTQAILIATADGHPRAACYTSWVPTRTVTKIAGHPFYAQLNEAQQGWERTRAQIAAARADLRTLPVGWVLVWLPELNHALSQYLSATGFAFSYRADGASVYRPAGSATG